MHIYVATLSVFFAVIPSTLGYIHAIFPYQLVFFLNWYLEVLYGLKESHFSLVSTRIQLYHRLSANVTSFVRLFGTCIVIDMAHSVMRIIFCAYFVSSLVGEPTASLRGMMSDILTVAGYLYLIFMICKKGSQLGIASGEFIKSCESGFTCGQKVFGIGQLQVSGLKLKKIWLDTDYFRVNLSLIAPVSLSLPIKPRTQDEPIVLFSILAQLSKMQNPSCVLGLTVSY